MMTQTPKSECPTFALVGRVNAGKSTLLNFIAGQDVAIVSPVPGTTTDVVEKAMELRPFGRIVFLDTAGIDDESALWQERRLATKRAVERADVVVVVNPDDATEAFLADVKKPRIMVGRGVSSAPAGKGLPALPFIAVDTSDLSQRDTFLEAFKNAIEKTMPGLAGVENPLDGLATSGGWIMHVVPIDSQAPKGRLILPQVMTLRAALDLNCRNIVTTEKEFAAAFADLKTPPQLVVCDSQVVEKVMAALPEEIPCTTYSILMARSKGGLAELAAGAAAIDTLRDNDRVLVAEVCTHHAGGDDIGRVKIPNLLKRKTGKTLAFDFVSGRYFADDAKRYALVVHCGGCMATRGQMAARIAQAKTAGVPITNYGVCIAHCQGVLTRALKPFMECGGLPPLSIRNEKAASSRRTP